MLALPPVDPPAWWRMQTRIGRDHYVRVDTNDYSVHPDAIGRTVTVLTDNDEVIALAPARGERPAPGIGRVAGGGSGRSTAPHWKPDGPCSRND
jgi:hypothetical protein